MHSIRLNLKERSYNIVVGSNILSLLGRYIAKLNIGSSAYIITNAAVKNRHGRPLAQTLRRCGFQIQHKLLADTEKSKSIENTFRVLQDLAGFDKRRRVFILAFGGGVIGDIAGFVASIYKRGIAYIQVPTTLLAQVDSSIGGKTAVDLAQGKNLVGVFSQPRLVFSDVGLLETLDLRQLRAGLAEVIKYGIIQDPHLFNYLEKKYKDIILKKDSVLEFIVRRCSGIKARIVQRDEKEERNIRTILNFGHTIGHALEAAGRYQRYNHGEAIALGMLVASGISQKLGLISSQLLERIENLIKAVGLPTKIKNVSLSDIIKAHYRDKKFIGSKNKFVLIEGLGRTKILEDIGLGIIKESIKNRLL